MSGGVQSQEVQKEDHVLGVLQGLALSLEQEPDPLEHPLVLLIGIVARRKVQLVVVEAKVHFPAAGEMREHTDYIFGAPGVGLCATVKHRVEVNGVLLPATQHGRWILVESGYKGYVSWPGFCGHAGAGNAHQALA